MTCLLCGALRAHATGEPRTSGAPNNAMGGTGIAQVNLFSAMNNQGALGFLESSQFGFFAEQRFIGLGIGNYASAVALRTTTGTFALSANSFGYEMYRHTRVGLAYGKSLGPKFSAGFQVNYIATSIPEYGSASTVAIELGILARPSRKWYLGAHVFNPTQARIGELDDYLPSVFAVGAAFQSSDDVLITAEVEKDIQFAPNFKAGIQYSISEKILLRGGFASNPALLTFGVGFRLSHLRIDMANTYHAILGSSPQTSLVYEAKKK